MNQKYRQSLIKQTIIDDFELKGGWVLNRTDLADDKKYKYGGLKYDHGDTNLILFQGFPSKVDRSFNFDERQRYTDIYGRLVEDKYNYVHCHRITEMSMHLFDYPVKEQKLYAKYFTVSNFSPDEKSKLNTLKLDYNLLDKLISPVQQFIPFNDGKGITFENKGIKLLGKIDNDGVNYSVYLSENVSRKSKLRDVYFKNSSFIEIIFDSTIDDLTAIKFANNFAKLFSCILNFPVNPIWVSKQKKLKRK